MELARLKMIFGFCLLAGIIGLAAAIALGRVEEKSSFGLPFILGSLTSLAGGFTNWAFGESRSSIGGKGEVR